MYMLNDGKRYELTFKRDYKEGPAELNFPDGSIRQMGSFLADSKHGVWTHEVLEKGRVVQKEEYLYDKGVVVSKKTLIQASVILGSR